MLVAASLRPAEAGADPALLAELAGDPLATTLHPRPLGDAAVDALVRGRLGEGADDAFVAACAQASGGNPLILGELLRALESEGVAPARGQLDVVRQLGPRAASRSVLLRLARLPADAAAVARAAALLGDGADLGAVATLAELDETRAGQATRGLARAEILRPEPPLGFVHPLIREAVLRDLGPGERELGHARAARIWPTAGLPPSRWRRTSSSCPGGGIRGRSRRCAWPRGRRSGRDRRRAQSPTCAARSRNRPTPTGAGRSSSTSTWPDR